MPQYLTDRLKNAIISGDSLRSFNIFNPVLELNISVKGLEHGENPTFCCKSKHSVKLFLQFASQIHRLSQIGPAPSTSTQSIARNATNALGIKCIWSFTFPVISTSSNFLSTWKSYCLTHLSQLYMSINSMTVSVHTSKTFFLLFNGIRPSLENNHSNDFRKLDAFQVFFLQKLLKKLTDGFSTESTLQYRIPF